MDSSDALPIDQMRQNYTMGGLDESDVDSDPLVQFQRWFLQAQATGVPDWFEANAMTLSTADSDGHVTSRIVLLKGIEEGQFIFYSNFTSAKGRQLDKNPTAALCFYWPHLQRQVRIQGDVDRISRRRAEAYFHTRPRASQLGAHVSEQSSEINSRGVLDSAMQRLESLYPEGETIPMPDHWGGYGVRPSYLEFWQGRTSRLHDRVVYRRQPDGWRIARLAP